LILALLIINIAFWLYIAKEKKGWSEPTPTSTDHPLISLAMTQLWMNLISTSVTIKLLTQKSTCVKNL
jgi:hypothetical protein